jgi:transposase
LQADQKIAALAFELENIKRAIFGSKSERNAATGLPGSMPSLFAGETIEVTDPSVTEQISYERNKPRASKVQPDRLDIADHIERKTIVLEPQGVDVSAMKRIGETVNRRLQHIPASFLLVETIRPKYKDPVTGLIYQASATDQTFAKSSVDESVAAHIVVQKIIDHLPLYRMARIFNRQGVNIPESTLGDIYTESSRILQPLYDAHRKDVLGGGYVNMDETTIRVQDSDKKAPRTKAITGCVTIMLRDQFCLCMIHRDHEELRKKYWKDTRDIFRQMDTVHMKSLSKYRASP